MPLPIVTTFGQQRLALVMKNAKASQDAAIGLMDGMAHAER